MFDVSGVRRSQMVLEADDGAEADDLVLSNMAGVLHRLVTDYRAIFAIEGEVGGGGGGGAK